MAYMRGENYVYVSGGGDDGDRIEFVCPDLTGSMPLEIFDQLVVMHYHKMTAEQREKAEKTAIERWRGNFGSWGLQKARGLDPEGDFDRRMAFVRRNTEG